MGLHDASLTVAPGQVVVLLGPNGSGKTTLLRLLATDLRARRGSVRLFGREAGSRPGRLRRQIGYVPDEDAHLESLSGMDNAVLFARMAGLKEDAARALASGLLERLGLGEDAAAPVSTWSFGMRRKLLLVEAFLHGPGLLLLDEPTVGLDLPSRAVFRELLRERVAGGAGAVVATNDVSEAGRIASRVVFLHRGRVVLEGSPAELLDELGAATRIEVRTRGPGAPGVPELPGAVSVEVGADRIVATTPNGSAALPGILQALVQGGIGVRSVQVREPHLGDVFRRVAGVELTGGSAEEP